MIAGLDMDALCMKFPMSLYLSLPFSTAVVFFEMRGRLKESKKQRDKVKDGIANFIEIRKYGNGSCCAILHTV